MDSVKIPILQDHKESLLSAGQNYGTFNILAIHLL